MITDSVLTETSVQLRRTFNAPRERVFRAWTEPDMLAGWFRPNNQLTTTAEVDLRVGGRYQIEMHPPEGDPYVAVGRYKVVDVPDKIVFTWRWTTDDLDNQEGTLVTVEFFERGPNQTEVVLTHEGHRSKEERDNHRDGWLGTYDMLAAYLSTEA